MTGDKPQNPCLEGATACWQAPRRHGTPSWRGDVAGQLPSSRHLHQNQPAPTHKVSTHAPCSLCLSELVAARCRVTAPCRLRRACGGQRNSRGTTGGAMRAHGMQRRLAAISSASLSRVERCRQSADPTPPEVVEELAVVEAVVIRGVALCMVGGRQGGGLVPVDGVVPAVQQYMVSAAIAAQRCVQPPGLRTLEPAQGAGGPAKQPVDQGPRNHCRRKMSPGGGGWQRPGDSLPRRDAAASKPCGLGWPPTAATLRWVQQHGGKPERGTACLKKCLTFCATSDGEQRSRHWPISALRSNGGVCVWEERGQH
jgi:hypothetical protein